ncbi:hypothetical protein AB0L22_24760 [Micromonospora haikouensis]|uniref:hypothetical protein n=1 Tax=Micromonospora haikouensis TaxID=686309 RepID=UPI0034261C4A
MPCWAATGASAQLIPLSLTPSHIGTGSDPTNSNYKADWDAAAERWNILGEMAASRGLKLYTPNHDAACNFLLDSGPLDDLGRPTRSSGIRKLEYFFAQTADPRGPRPG